MSSSDSPSWQRIFEIFEECIELPAEERGDFLAKVCDSPEQRRRVEEMIEADDRGETTTFDQPFLARGPQEQGLGDVPETIGSYRILRQLGQGGMSTVYLAVRADDAFRRHVVVKLVRRGMETEPILRRLRTERQILASLDHPYVAKLYDGGSTPDGLPYFVMEYVDGVFLDEYCEHNGLSVDQRIELFRKVCSAVRYAHQNLVIHRDLKPSNILVTGDGDPKLLDFGIARLLNPDLSSAEADPTMTWHRVLTPSFASPEQMRGRQVTTASDVYSLGVVLYKLLTGKLPRIFRGRSQSEIERLLIETDPTPPSKAYAESTADASTVEEREWSTAIRKQLSGDLDAIVLKALRSAPAQRYGSVEELDGDLERYQQGRPVEARAGNWRYRLGKLVRRHRLAVASMAGVLILLTGFVAAMLARSAQVARERDQARLERDKKEEVLELLLDVFRFSNPYVLPGEELKAREALSRSVPVLESGLKGQPEVRAELLHTSGSILHILGDHRTAETQLREALEIRRERLGEGHADSVETLSALAAVRGSLGKLEEAEDLALQAVELGRAVGGEPLLAALTELVAVRCHLSQFQAAENPARDALALARELPAREKETLILEFLGRIESSKGDYGAAEGFYRQALELWREQFGDGHPAQISSLSNLGMVLRRRESFGEAERVYRGLVALQEESFGEDFRDPITLANLAGLRLGREDFAGATEYFGKALEAIRESSGPDHWMAYVFELALLDIQVQSGEPEAAEGGLRQLLDLWRPRMGEDSWRIAQGEGVLGESLSAQGRCQQAEPLLTASFDSLVAKARARQKRDALDRLRRHFERCGEARDLEPYAARISAS